MLNVSDLIEGSRDMTIDFGEGNELNLTYDPTVISSNMLMDLKSNSDELCQILSELIISWDLVSNDGGPFEPTHENLTNMPLALVNKFFEEIFADAFPKAASTTSEDTTPPKVRRVTKKGRR